MKKILLLTSVTIILSACGGGGGGDSSSNSLAINGDSLGVASFGGMNGQMRSGSSSAKKYNPNYTVDITKSSIKVAGNSMMSFDANGNITLNSELCITNDNDCGAMREAVVAKGKIKYRNNSGTQSLDATQLYSRDRITLSNNQKVNQSVAKAAFGSLADMFDVHIVDSNSVSGGNRDGLKGASWIDIGNDNRDVFHDPNSKYYWGKDGVKNSGGGRVQIISISSKKNGGFAKYARLGIMGISYTKNGQTIPLEFANIGGEYTTAAGLSKVGARYTKAGGFKAIGVRSGHSVYLQGNVDINIDVNQKKITNFKIDNINYQRIADNRENGIAGARTLSIRGLDSMKLQNNNAISYDANGKYAGVLTNNGVSQGSTDWQANFEGNFFGPSADETAGVVRMYKKGDVAKNNLVGGYAADKQ